MNNGQFLILSISNAYFNSYGLISFFIKFLILQKQKTLLIIATDNSCLCSFVLFWGHAAELLTTNKLSELACLALYLMYEKKQGKKSFWYPFIRELDRQRGRGQLAVESPLLWSEAELDYLSGSPTKVKADMFA